jgi:hypothetical protein
MESILKAKLDELDFSQPLSFINIRGRTRINGKLINGKYMLGFLYHSNDYRRVDPFEIGSGKHKHNLNVWAKV